MVNLFTTFYNERNPERASELRDCLSLNIECQVIDKIYIWLENLSDVPVQSEKIVIIPATSRPRFNDFFEAVNNVTHNNDINIITNSDIFFKDDIGIIKNIKLNNRCLALTRWDIEENSEAKFLGRVDSQDTWIFKGKIRGIDGVFFLGSLGCDNKIAYEIQKAGYAISNPSLSVKSYHLHLTQCRPGLSSYSANPLPGPYLYIPITHHKTNFKNWVRRISGKLAVNKKNNHFLMHRLYESRIREMISQKNRNFAIYMGLLIKCFYYRPALNKKYVNYFIRKLVKPSLKICLKN